MKSVRDWIASLKPGDTFKYLENGAWVEVTIAADELAYPDLHQQTWLAARETLAIQLMALSYGTYRGPLPDWRHVQPSVKTMWRGEAEKIMRGEA